MIQEFIDRFMDKKDDLRAVFAEKHPEDYIDIVRAIVNLLHDPSDYRSIDPARIHQIDYGEGFSGALIFVIASSGYQPDQFWYTMVDYGSCTGCDALLSIRGYGHEKPTDEQISDYMTLALHILQKMKKITY